MAKGLGVFAVMVLLIMLGPVLFALGGGVAGWAVSGVFPQSFDVLLSFFPEGTTGFQVGVVLGFVGGMLRSSAATSSNQSITRKVTPLGGGPGC